MNEMLGKPVVAALAEKFEQDIAALAKVNMTPKLAIIRVGEREDDISYERGLMKRFAAMGALAEVRQFPLDVPQASLEEALSQMNQDDAIHGILIFRPLPKPLSEERLRNRIAPAKDVDCMSSENLYHLFAGDGQGYPPCTPQAVIELLDYNQINVSGKRVTIVGRSLVVGKPLAMLLLARHATISICHTRTADLAAESRRADILIACAGSAKMIKPDFTHPDQIVIDVGINMCDGKLCGDVDYAAVADQVQAITPVPGGVGAITTSVLLKHTIKSAMAAAAAKSGTA
jgi:methylenetetrahydrofolate dehydrogenase (NADP+) / methenyltetrahydrofolate cyclohydrolase